MTPISRTLKVMAHQARSRRKRPTESEKTTVINFANFDLPLNVLPHLDVLQFGHLIFCRRFQLVTLQDLLNLLLCSDPFPPLSPPHRCRDDSNRNKIEIFYLFSEKNPRGRCVIISSAHIDKFLETLATHDIPHNPSEKIQNLLGKPTKFKELRKDNDCQEIILNTIFDFEESYNSTP